MDQSHSPAARELLQTLQSIGSEGCSEDDRKLLLTAAKAVVGRLSSAWEQVWQATVTDPVKLAAMRTLTLMDPFERWCKEGWEPKTSAELEALCKCDADVDVDLLTRLLDVATACHLLLREGDKYSPGPYEWAPASVRDPMLKGACLGFVDWTSPLFLNLPHFLKDSKFQNPRDGSAANYQHLYKRDGVEVYKSMASDPYLSQGVQDFMQANTKHTLTPWTRIFPIKAVADGLNDGQVLVVDVGGGSGQDLRLVAEEIPQLSHGSLVLQDLPNVVEAVNLGELEGIINKQPYNYMTPQPMKGARYYYFKNVIHNLPDELAVKVLQNQTAAMGKDSRLLIYERFKGPPGIPESADFTAFSSLTAQDVFMMGMFLSQERWQAQYRSILAEAGFEIVQIHEPRKADGSELMQFSRDRVIEARMAQR